MAGRHWWEWTAWTLGVGLGSLYIGARLWSSDARAQGIEEFHAARVTSVATTAPRKGVPTTVDQSSWSMQRAAALLHIPSLALAVPIYEGTGELALNSGAGRIEGTARLSDEGNIGLAAHRDGFFRALKDIALDAEVQLDAGDRLLRYRVIDISIVAPEEVHVLAPTAIPSITLVTCYPFYFVGNAPQRYIVRAQLTDATSVASGG
jgi:sortase A